MLLHVAALCSTRSRRIAGSFSASMAPVMFGNDNEAHWTRLEFCEIPILANAIFLKQCFYLSTIWTHVLYVARFAIMVKYPTILNTDMQRMMYPHVFKLELEIFHGVDFWSRFCVTVMLSLQPWLILHKYCLIAIWRQPRSSEKQQQQHTNYWNLSLTFAFTTWCVTFLKCRFCHAGVQPRVLAIFQFPFTTVKG